MSLSHFVLRWNSSPSEVFAARVVYGFCEVSSSSVFSYWNYHVREVEMGGTCNTDGKLNITYNIWDGKPEMNAPLVRAA
jgi:hypothetical protein